MIVYVKKYGDRIPVECADEVAIERLRHVHGPGGVDAPAGYAPVMRPAEPPVEPTVELPPAPAEVVAELPPEVPADALLAVPGGVIEAPVAEVLVEEAKTE